MIDEKLEEQLIVCQHMMKLWRTFHDYFASGVKGIEVDPQKERELLQIKSHISMMHDTFMESLGHDQNIGQNIIGIVGRCITLKHLKKLSAADIKKIEIEWHESYLLINETLGTLLEKKDQLAKINPVFYHTARAFKSLSTQLHNLFVNPVFRFTAIAAIVIGILVGLPMAGVIDYKTNKYTKPIYQQVEKILKKIKK